MYSPFEAFVHNFDLLQTVAAEINEQDNEQKKQARKDLELLLGVISGGSSGDEKLNKYFKMRDSYLSDGTIQFDDLWTIFPPGALIYGKPFQGEEQVFVVADNWSPWPRIRDHPSTWKPWGLACWVYDWTGAEFKRTPFDVKIEGFEGRKPVTSLPYYPLESMETSELRSIKAKLTARGKKFRKYCEAKEGSRMFEYAGAAIHGMKGFTGMGQDGTVSQPFHNVSTSPTLHLRTAVNMLTCRMIVILDQRGQSTTIWSVYADGDRGTMLRYPPQGQYM